MIEGRARVILDMTEAELEAGDILVTATPTPVVYLVRRGQGAGDGGGRPDDPRRGDRPGDGLRPVVVQQATELIRDGQRTVHGTEGYVEVLA